MHAARKTRAGLTLVELVLASALLAVAAAPVLNALGHGLLLAQQIERRTRATFLAQQRMEQVLADAADNYNQNFTRINESLGGGYYVTVRQAAAGAITKNITVEVGRDTSGNGLLDASEVLVAIATSVVDLGP